MERISFEKLICEILRCSRLSRKEIGVFVPLIYKYEDKYFLPFAEYVRTGKMQCVSFEGYSTELMQQTMDCSYTEALVLLHNLEERPEKSGYIYNPMEIL